MHEEQRPPDLDEVAAHVDEFLDAEGAGHWGPRRARCVMGVVGGRPAFTACVDHVARRLPAAGPRPLLALAVAFAATAPRPMSSAAEGLWQHCADGLTKSASAPPYLNRPDRRALDLVVAEALRDPAVGVAWEIPRAILAVAAESTLDRLARGGVDIRLGPIPHSPSIAHRAHRLAQTLVGDTCNCDGGPRTKPHCRRPDEHSLKAWDPYSATLGEFIDRAVGGPGGDGVDGLTEPGAS